MDSYLPCMGLGGPDMFLRSLLLTIKPVALSIHHSEWQRTHPTMSAPPLTVRQSILRSSSIAERPFLVLPGKINTLSDSCLYKSAITKYLLKLRLVCYLCLHLSAFRQTLSRRSVSALNEYLQLSHRLSLDHYLGQTFSLLG